MIETLHLDSRHRAMLAEMGVRVWAPAVEAAPLAKVAIEAAAPSRMASAAELAARAIEQAAGRSAVAPVKSTAPLPRPEGVAQMDWPTLQATVATCQACGLCSTRKNTVFGVGGATQKGQVPQVDWLIVGEVPGEAEDAQGEPFVGQAGQLLDNMLSAIGVSRKTAGTAAGGGVYISNVLKCRTPGNRNPKPEEVAQCLPYLERQVALLQPKMVVAMGRFAMQALLRTSVPEVDATPLGQLRGRIHRAHGVPVVVTYHPAYVLRNLPEKAKVWADLCLAKAHLRASDQG